MHKGSPNFARRKNPASDWSGIITLLGALLLTFFAIHSASPPSVVSRTAVDTVFSAERAKDHVEIIANSPHSIGTIRNDSVRNYIQSTCIRLGMETRIQSATSFRIFRNVIIAGKVNNIIARVKGTDSGRAVLIMGHYDSQPNTPGAGDDAAASSAMLEAARALKSSGALRNDIIFLFTDGEEVGLLGAQAFADDPELMRQVALVLNYDGRGNSGVAMAFEVNRQNGWIMKEFAKAAPYPVANSFSYEVYKLLPNFTDYSVFKSKGIAGINSGIIEGFANYHSMTDVPASLDLRTVQHYGSNMLALAKHFGDMNLKQTKGADICYFNFIGSWLIHYPASWNLFFLVFTTILFILFLIVGFRRNRINARDFIIGVFIFLGALILLMGVAFLIEKLIKSWYPLYTRFDGSNYYNSGYYFLTITAASISLFALVYQWAARKYSPGSLQAGALLWLMILMFFANVAIPTAGYLFFFPVIFLLTGSIFIYVKGVGVGEYMLAGNIISLIFLVPAILLFAPVVYLNFVAFGLERTFIPVMMLGILLGMLIQLFYPVLKYHRFLITNLSLMIALIGFVLGHISSGSSEQNPLRVNLWYRLNADSSKAEWVSDYLSTDRWTQKFFPRTRKKPIKESFSPLTQRLMNDAVILPIPAPVLTIIKDTVEGSTRKLMLHLTSSRNALSMDILFSSKNIPRNISINGKHVELAAPVDVDAKILSISGNDKYDGIAYYGLDSTGINLDFEISNSKTEIVLIDRSLGLSGIKGFTGYAANVIPGPDRNSNTIQVVKRFSF